MQKRKLLTILGVMLAVVVASLSLVFAVGPRVSAMSKHDRIVVLDSWEDFSIDESGVCYGLSRVVLEDYFGYTHQQCDEWGGDSKIEYDEVRICIPNGVTELCIECFWNYWFYSDFTKKIKELVLPNTLEYIDWHAICAENLTSIIIPDSVVGIDRDAFIYCDNLTTIYCECSEAYADENWGTEWKGDCDAEVVWNCNKTIIFDTQGGSVIENQTICVDSLVAEPTAPTKDGYEFNGWLLKGEPYDFATPVTADMTLTAKWEEVQAQPEPETPAEENSAVNNQNDDALIWGIAGTAAGILIIGGIVFGIVIAKRRRK